MKSFNLFLLLLTFSGHLQAQSNKEIGGIDTLTLQDLMDIKLTVASAIELTPRESPGIVTYITAEDIRKTGARDLMEVLQFVPGFEYGVDVEGVVGLGIRGNWAHEGKVVLLIDGLEMNETLFSTLQFGNHYPTDNIERIEIIRGPGSAMYGGFAAYAVINVVSRKPQKNQETSASVQTGVGEKGVSRKSLSAYHGLVGQNASGAIHVSYSQGERSQSDYRDVYGNSYNMHNNSDLNNLYINGNLKIGKTNIQLIADQYHIVSRDEYITATKNQYDVHFNSYFGSVTRDFNINNKWKVNGKLNGSVQQPWKNTEPREIDEGTPTNILTSRINGQINLNGHVTDKFDLITGIEYFYDRSKDNFQGSTFRTSGSRYFSYHNSAIFVQGLYSIKKWNLIAGIRGNYNSEFDPTLTPRVGATYARDSWHIKALYNKSFRSPSTLNLDLAPTIRPEQTSVTEIEAGIQIHKKIYLTANFYTIHTNDPIVYYYDTLSNDDAYTNLTRTGSVGMELYIQYKGKRSTIETNASFYQTPAYQILKVYAAPDEDQYLGLSPVKINIRYCYSFSNQLRASLSIFQQGKKWAITSFDENDNQHYEKINAFTQINLFAEYNFRKHKGWGIAAGVNNLLDQEQWFVQPYNNNHAPLPGMGREITAKIYFKNF
jgi:outer membrane receptor for ferrienterochelin and colicin